MIGCFMLFAATGFFVMMGIYMASMMAFFGVLGTAMGIYMAAMASFFTAFFIIMFG
jgi:hypothetical protein